MASLKLGDRVRVIRRETTDADRKSGTYYAHFGGLVGAVQKVYGPSEIAVDVEHETLPSEIRKRHLDIRDQMKTKWLDGLSEEGRGKLTEREKDFHLRYVILVAQADLENAGPRPEKSSVAAPAPSREAPRKTSVDLDAAEEAEIQRRLAQ
ncbi:MAG TPA: hypothetical protein VLH79_02730 [Chthonomonadales bacterium]|nr:hypothetical protein [Chthonomonadales bacterium]